MAAIAKAAVADGDFGVGPIGREARLERPPREGPAVRAKAAIVLRAQNRLHRLEQAFIEAPTNRREGRKAPNPSGGFALQAPGGLT
jgi:hypothetical protein